MRGVLMGAIMPAHGLQGGGRFREVPIGEWIGPHRLQKPQDLLWYADSQPEQGLYRCRNDYRATETTI